MVHNTIIISRFWNVCSINKLNQYYFLLNETQFKYLNKTVLVLELAYLLYSIWKVIYLLEQMKVNKSTCQGRQIIYTCNKYINIRCTFPKGNSTRKQFPLENSTIKYEIL
jgi:hypothetical protein